ncbi:response regulator transcription factor [Lacinutrix sp. Bg11-31]|uniref:response regulator transcription factor n=1 Tax=Lacinutrix sp. Bg11-31 TaxID=2057808 RepID=UPI000C304715|nr:response regulator transcription factor [Lacinutrix sp. Bg11-31]AUC81716.1 response regulator [Lacinutrix sp. Bg11-31]
MFKKVLIADDLGSINQGVTTVLNALGINNIEQVQYCDDAVLKIKRAVLDNVPFDLVITDLSFVIDHRAQKLTSGDALAKFINNNYPELKVIVYSVEDRLQRVRTLIKTDQVNAYVCKGRRGLIEIEKAITAVYLNQLFVSPQVAQALSKKSNLDIDDYDITLAKQLSHGKDQKGISAYLVANNITPSSVSSIEKHLTKLRIHFKADNATHLVSIMKDLGLI